MPDTLSQSFVIDSTAMTGQIFNGLSGSDTYTITSSLVNNVTILDPDTGTDETGSVVKNVIIFENDVTATSVQSYSYPNANQPFIILVTLDTGAVIAIKSPSSYSFTVKGVENISSDTFITDYRNGITPDVPPVIAEPTSPFSINEIPQSATQDVTVTVGQVFARTPDDTTQADGYHIISQQDSTGATITGFAIDNQGNITYTGQGLDADSGVTHVTLILTATNATATSEPKTIQIAINDLNDVPPTINEGTFGSELIDGNTVSDTQLLYQASGTSDTVGITWSISGADVDAGLIEINASTGVVTFVNSTPLDHEVKDSYSFTLTATSGLLSTTATEAITISVTDINDVAPVFNNAPTDGTNSAITVGEHTEGTAAVVIFDGAATPDVDGAAVTYEITSGGDYVQVNRNTGSVTLKATADMESGALPNGTFSFTIKATVGTLQKLHTVDVTLTDVNDNTPEISNHNLVISSGDDEAIVLSEDNLSFTDDDVTDEDASNITYTIKSMATGISITNGVTSLTKDDTFTHQDIKNGNIKLTVTDESALSNLKFTISDGTNTNSTEFQFVVNVREKADIDTASSNQSTAVDFSTVNKNLVIDTSAHHAVTTVTASRGSDEIIAGLGVDTINLDQNSSDSNHGDSDTVIFNFESRSTSFTATDGGDTINGFRQGQDIFQLQTVTSDPTLQNLNDLLSNAGSNNRMKFHVNSTFDFDPVAGQVVITITGVTVIFSNAGVDNNGTSTGGTVTINFDETMSWENFTTLTGITDENDNIIPTKFDSNSGRLIEGDAIKALMGEGSLVFDASAPATAIVLKSNASKTLSEDTDITNGVEIGGFDITDSDGGRYGTLEIAQNNNDDGDLFEIANDANGNKVLKLKAGTTLDHESGKTSLSVRVQLKENPSVSDNIVIQITDANDVAPVFDNAPTDGTNSAVTVSEYTSSNAHAEIFDGAATPDVVGANVTYSITSGEVTQDGQFVEGIIDYVTIDPSSGIVTLNANADFDSKPVFSFQITATVGSLEKKHVVTVNLTDVDDEAPEVTQSDIIMNPDEIREIILTQDIFTLSDPDTIIGNDATNFIYTIDSLPIGITITRNDGQSGDTILNGESGSNTFTHQDVLNGWICLTVSSGSELSGLRLSISDGINTNPDMINLEITLRDIADVLAADSNGFTLDQANRVDFSGTAHNQMNYVIDTGAGQDIITGSHGSDEIKAGLGRDTINLDPNLTDSITGGRDIVIYNFGAGSTSFTATDGGDTINGFRRGQDVFQLQTSTNDTTLQNLDDLLTGANSNDRMKFLVNRTSDIDPTTSQAVYTITGVTIIFSTAGVDKDNTSSGGTVTINFDETMSWDNFTTLTGITDKNDNIIPTKFDSNSGRLFEVDAIKAMLGDGSLVYELLATDVSLASDANTSIAENTDTPNWNKIGDINITDPDNSHYGTLELAGANAELFEIRDGENGKELWLKSNTPLNYEDSNPNTMNVRVQLAEDNTIGDDVTVTVTNKPIEISSNKTGAPLAENAAVLSSQIIYTAQGTTDGSETIEWSLEGADAELFSIDNNGRVKFKTATSPDFETKSSYSFTVVAASGDLEPDEKDITIRVTNQITENITFGDDQLEIGTDANPGVVQINASVGHVVGSFKALSLNGKTISYSLSGPDSQYYTIAPSRTDSTTYEIKLLKQYNFIDSTTHEIIITASASSESSVTYPATIEVNKITPSLRVNKTIFENQRATIQIDKEKDSDGDTLSFVPVSGVTRTTNGSYFISESGVLVWTPDSDHNFTSPEIFSVNIQDSRGGITSKLISVTVNSAIENSAITFTGGKVSGVYHAYEDNPMRNPEGQVTLSGTAHTTFKVGLQENELTTVGSYGATIKLLYGSLTVNKSGRWNYILNNEHAAVKDLDGNNNDNDGAISTLVETILFSYERGGQTYSKTINITINGATNLPGAVPGTNTSSTYGETGDLSFNFPSEETTKGRIYVRGGEGNDVIHAYNVSTTMSGGNGDDWFYGSFGGSWNYVVLQAGDGNDVADGGTAGVDTLSFRAYSRQGPYNITLHMNDEIKWRFDQFTQSWLPSDSSRSDYTTRSDYTHVRLWTDIDGDGRGGGTETDADDEYDYLTNLEIVYYYGSDGRDVITGGGTSDKLYGYGGNDVLNGERGSDIISGGLGLDVLDGGSGTDTYDTSSSWAYNKTPQSKYSVHLNIKDTNLWRYDEISESWVPGSQNAPGTHIRVWFDLNDDNRDVGNEDFDYIINFEKIHAYAGNGDNNHIIGGNYNDYVQSGLDNKGIFDGGGGINTFALAPVRYGINFDFESLPRFTLNNNIWTPNQNNPNENDYFLIWRDMNGDGSFNSQDKYNYIRNFQKFEFVGDVNYEHNDTVAGGSGDDKLDGGRGNDVLNGRDGNDVIDGGYTGNDTLIGGKGRDYLEGASGDDIFVLYQGSHAVGETNVDIVKDFTPGNLNTIGDRIRVDVQGNVDSLQALKTAANIYWTKGTSDTTIYTNQNGQEIEIMILQNFTEDLTLANFEIV
jgi:VCBS repeat-containing protein